MLKQPSWVKRYKEDVEDQITVIGRAKPQTMPTPRNGAVTPIAPPSYSTGAGSDGRVQPRNPAMMDLTVFHEGEEVIPHKTVKMAGGHENVREAVQEEVAENGYRAGGTVRGYFNGGTVGSETGEQRSVRQTIKPPQFTAANTSQNTNTWDKFKPVMPAEAQKTVQPAIGLDTKPAMDVKSGAIQPVAPPKIELDAKPAMDVQSTPAQPPAPIKPPEFKPTDVDSKITVDPNVKVDPKYKGYIDESIDMTRDIARGDSEVAKTISNRAMQGFDARSQTEMNRLKMQIANDPNMTEGQKRTAIASAMRDIGSQRSTMMGEMAETEMNRAEGAIGDMARMAGSQQAYEAANEKFRIDRETANQIYEKNFDYTQDYNNNVQDYMVSKDRRDFEYKSAWDTANAAATAGDYGTANAAFDKLGFQVDFSKATDQEAQAQLGEALAAVTSDITAGYDFDNELVQKDLARAYEAMNGKGSAVGPEFEKWAKGTFDSAQTKQHPIYGPISSMGDEFIENLMTGFMKTDNNPDWVMDDFKYGNATGVEAGKQALAALMFGGGLDPETGAPNLDNPIWDMLGMGPEGQKASGVEPELVETPVEKAFTPTGDVDVDAPEEMSSILQPIRDEFERLKSEGHTNIGLSPGQTVSNHLQAGQKKVYQHLTGLTRESWEPILSDPNLVKELKDLGVLQERSISSSTISRAEDAQEMGLKFPKATQGLYKGGSKNVKQLVDKDNPSIVLVGGVPYQLESYDRSYRGSKKDGVVTIKGKNLITGQSGEKIM